MSGNKREDGYWDKAKFIKGECPEEKLKQFGEQLEQIKTYYKVFKKFHAHDLPKTNYDVLKEEAAELDGLVERDLITTMNANYQKVII